METNVTGNDLICILIGLLIHVTAVFLSLISQERQCCCSEDKVRGMAARKTLAKFPVISKVNYHGYNSYRKKAICLSLFLVFHSFSWFLFIFDMTPVTKWPTGLQMFWVFKIDHKTIHLNACLDAS